jgi:hypothetical protein
MVALPSDLITLFSRLYLDNIPIPILVEGIVMYKRVCFPLQGYGLDTHRP